MRNAAPSIAVALLLASCGDSGAPSGEGAGAARGEALIACATDGSRQWERACTVETTQGPDGPILVVRGPDGGFRRLAITSDGRGVVAADGAEPALVTPAGEGLIEVAIGNDRYRLPATVKSAPR
ncbi:hypothetical protein [Sphingomonas sp.]|uniref:hypothetical protein n=1 Tax=Sphingomonas sp. TaxID=28214 RepID=UPI002FC5A27C